MSYVVSCTFWCNFFCARRDNIVEEKVTYIDVTKEWLDKKSRTHRVVIDKIYIDDNGIKHPIKGKEKIEKIQIRL